MVRLAGDLLAEVVGADTDVAGVDGSEESVCHGVHWVGQVGCAQDGVVHEGGGGSGNNCRGDSRRGNDCGSNGRCGGNNSVVAETVAKTSKDDLSIGISLPLLVVVSMVMVVVEGGGTGDRDVGTVHTRGALEGQGVAVVTVVSVVSVVASVRVGAPLPAAGHSGSKVVGAETNVARVDEACRGGGHSVDRVGQASVAKDGRGNSGNSRGSNGVVAETVANRAETSNNHLSVSLSFPLPAAGHCSSKVVGAETNVAGVDKASRGGSNSVDWVGKSRGAEDGRGGIGGSIGVTKTSKDDLSISLGFPLLPSKRPGSIGESSVGQGGSSTGHGQVQSVHARGALASKGVHSVSIGDGEGRVDHVGRGDGRNCGKSNLENIEGYLFFRLWLLIDFQEDRAQFASISKVIRVTAGERKCFVVAPRPRIIISLC